MKKDVLIIEDDEDIRYLIAYVLKKAQYEVRIGASAGDLSSELSVKRPDIIILDIMLPDGNGVELCRKLKEDRLTRHIPVIIMSAHQFSNLEDACADDFISKPFSIKQIVATVERVSG
ncbi:response regulator [Niabella sp. CC-SYL272]|uniref:response regulator n=1 Tax=Niabella agricola TaxID=2891571 RepID=UPI001F34AD8A|nr:response regulator [Niabella agricola]MCF3107606.1 response regulator [Niabella agricola]